MGNLLIALFFGAFIFQGCLSESVQHEKEYQVLSALQNDVWGGGIETVKYDEESKTYEMISKSFAAMAQRELDGTHRWVNYDAWDHFVDARIDDLFEETEERLTISSLGSGYTAKKICPETGEALLIVTDGELIYDVVNGFAK